MELEFIYTYLKFANPIRIRENGADQAARAESLPDAAVEDTRRGDVLRLQTSREQERNILL